MTEPRSELDMAQTDTRRSVDELLRELGSLPTLPDVALRARRMLADPECRMHQVAELISRDPVLAGRVVRIANSGLYGNRSEPFSLQQAVVRMGSREVERLLVTVAVMGVVPELQGAMSLHSFWCAGLGTAIAAKKLAADVKFEDPEAAYLAGLVHGMGEALLALRRPEQFEEAVRAASDADDLCAVLSRVIGLPLPALTAELLRQWELPDAIIEAVQHYRNPTEAPAQALLASIVLCANRICRGLGLIPEAMGDGDEDWDREIPEMLHEALGQLGFADLDYYLLHQGETLSEIEEVVSETFRQ